MTSGKNHLVKFVIVVLFFSGLGGFISIQAIRIITLENYNSLLHRENNSLRERLSRLETFETKYLDSVEKAELLKYHLDKLNGNSKR